MISESKELEITKIIDKMVNLRSEFHVVYTVAAMCYSCINPIASAKQQACPSMDSPAPATNIILKSGADKRFRISFLFLEYSSKNNCKFSRPEICILCTCHNTMMIKGFQKWQKQKQVGVAFQPLWDKSQFFLQLITCFHCGLNFSKPPNYYLCSSKWIGRLKQVYIMLILVWGLYGYPCHYYG